MKKYFSLVILAACSLSKNDEKKYVKSYNVKKDQEVVFEDKREVIDTKTHIEDNILLYKEDLPDALHIHKRSLYETVDENDENLAKKLINRKIKNIQSIINNNASEFHSKKQIFIEQLESYKISKRDGINYIKRIYVELKQEIKKKGIDSNKEITEKKKEFNEGTDLTEELIGLEKISIYLDKPIKELSEKLSKIVSNNDAEEVLIPLQEKTKEFFLDIFKKKIDIFNTVLSIKQTIPSNITPSGFLDALCTCYNYEELYSIYDAGDLDDIIIISKEIETSLKKELSKWIPLLISSKFYINDEKLITAENNSLIPPYMKLEVKNNKIILDGYDIELKTSIKKE